jgi:Uma2 family endonuclease
MDTLVRPLTKADFHAFMAREPEGRFEFEDGRIINMTGGTGNHSGIGFRFGSAIERQIDGEKYMVHGSDRGVELPQSVRYPDAIVEALPFDGDSRWTKEPVLIVEVLSDDSQKRDKVTKVEEYLTIETLRAYIVAEPDAPDCLVWVRGADGRFPEQPETVAGADGVINVPALGLSLKLAEVYRHILRR